MTAAGRGQPLTALPSGFVHLWLQTPFIAQSPQASAARFFMHSAIMLLMRSNMFAAAIHP